MNRRSSNEIYFKNSITTVVDGASILMILNVFNFLEEFMETYLPQPCSSNNSSDLPGRFLLHFSVL